MSIKLIIAFSMLCVVMACKPAMQGDVQLRYRFEGVIQDYITYKLPQAAKPEGEAVLVVAKAAFDECESLLPSTWLYKACLSEHQGVAMNNLKLLELKYSPLGSVVSNA